MSVSSSIRHPVTLRNAPMRAAPVNELGVVFLFAHKAQSLGFRIESIQPGFPDCLARRSAGDHEREVRIEFEYRSRSFLVHGHDARKCDCIVCWEHNWPDCPRRLEIIELRSLFELPPNIWLQPAIKSQWFWLDDAETCTWAVSPRARKGDILLMYRCHPLSAITDIYRLEGIQQRKPAEWRNGDCFGAPIRRLTKLRRPISFSSMREHPMLRNASFVRGNMQGVRQVSEYWPALYQLIAGQNSAAVKHLRKCAPV